MKPTERDSWELPEFKKNEFSLKYHKYCVCIFVINEGERFHKQLNKMKYLKNFNYIYFFLVVAGLVSIGLYIKTTDLIRIARHELMACFVFRGGK